jgi:tRNA pseudouridine38-40 synthase
MISKSKRFLARIAFKGTQFQGWQTQHQGRSVQEQVEKALSQICNQPIKVYGASRTDAGVHARGFACHFDGATSLSTQELKHRINRLLSDDILVTSLSRVRSDFEARFSKSKKVYSYRVLTGNRDPFLVDTTYFVPFRIDEKSIQTALGLFLGKKRFYAFTTKPEDQSYFIRTIHHVHLVKRGRLFIFTFIGDGFLTHMVRMIVGTILAYAQNKITLAEIRAYLDNNNKGRVSYKAPPQGLCLEKVIYESTTS